MSPTLKHLLLSKNAILKLFSLFTPFPLVLGHRKGLEINLVFASALLIISTHEVFGALIIQFPIFRVSWNMPSILSREFTTFFLERNLIGAFRSNVTQPRRVPAHDSELCVCHGLRKNEANLHFIKKYCRNISRLIHDSIKGCESWRVNSTRSRHIAKSVFLFLKF